MEFRRVLFRSDISPNPTPYQKFRLGWPKVPQTAKSRSVVGQIVKSARRLPIRAAGREPGRFPDSDDRRADFFLPRVISRLPRVRRANRAARRVQWNRIEATRTTRAGKKDVLTT